MGVPTFHVFVYGSLLSGFKSEAYAYISRYFDLIGVGKVKGKLYDYGDYPVARPTNEERFIKGELYMIKDPLEYSWAITQLDDYEGVLTEADEKPLYSRELADVYIGEHTVKSWVYWFNEEVSDAVALDYDNLIDYLKDKNK